MKNQIEYELMRSGEERQVIDIVTSTFDECVARLGVERERLIRGSLWTGKSVPLRAGH